jgi:hypothetical protein
MAVQAGERQPSPHLNAGRPDQCTMCAHGGHRAWTARGGVVGGSSSAALERSGWRREHERGKVETPVKEEGTTTHQGGLATARTEMRSSWRRSPVAGVLWQMVAVLLSPIALDGARGGQA